MLCCRLKPFGRTRKLFLRVLLFNKKVGNCTSLVSSQPNFGETIPGRLTQRLLPWVGRRSHQPSRTLCGHHCKKLADPASGPPDEATRSSLLKGRSSSPSMEALIRPWPPHPRLALTITRARRMVSFVGRQRSRRFSMITLKGVSRQIVRKPDSVSFSSRMHLAKSRCHRTCVDLPLTARRVCVNPSGSLTNT